MAETVYRVRTIYSVEGIERARGETDGAARSMGVFSSAIGHAKSQLMGLATLGGGLAIVSDHLFNLSHHARDAAGAVFRLNSVVENAGISMAGLMEAGGAVGNFNDSLAVSQRLINTMMLDAAKIPGTFEDLQMVTQLAMVQGLQAHKSVGEIEKMSMRVFTASKMLDPRMNGQMIGQEFAAMMEGRARLQMTLFASMKGLMAPDMTAGKFNALDQAGRWSAIEKAIQGMDPAMKKFGESGTAVVTTLQMNFENFIRYATGGMYEAFKSDAGKINAWFLAHQSQAVEFGHKIGDSLLSAFRAVKEVFEGIYEHRAALLHIAEAFGAITIAGALGKGAMGASGALGENMAALGGGGFWAAQKAALVSGAPSLGQVAGGAALGLAASRLTHQTDSINTTLMTLEGAFSSLPGPIGLVAKALGGFHFALGGVADFIDNWQKREIERRSNEGSAMAALKRGDALALKSALSDLRDQKGPLRLYDAKGKFNYGVYASYLEFIQGRGVGAARISHESALQMATRAKALLDALPVKKPVADRLDAMLNAKNISRKADVHIGTVQINQSIEHANDPDRVLIKTKEALEQAYFHPIESASNRFATLR
ncbi:MAG: hypothetical protein ACHQWU_09080 [Gemmatimonadales bacterium]